VASVARCTGGQGGERAWAVVGGWNGALRGWGGYAVIACRTLGGMGCAVSWGEERTCDARLVPFLDLGGGGSCHLAAEFDSVAG